MVLPMKNIITTLLIMLIASASLFSQALTVFKIDTSAFPVMKANFYIFDEDNIQVIEPEKKDFKVVEDWEECEVLRVSCPKPTPPVAISSVLTMDVSGSMSGAMINRAKAAGRAWINGLPLGLSECAITSFNDVNNMIKDFSKDRKGLLNKLSLLKPGGGTDYNQGFIEPMAGGVRVAKTGKYKRVLVFLTDGMPNFKPNIDEIIKQAVDNDITIYAVTLNMLCPPSLKEISEQTGGLWFENVTTTAQAREVYLKILQTAQGNEPCEIEWQSRVKCYARDKLLNIHYKPFNIGRDLIYPLPYAGYASLVLNPNGVYFRINEPGKQYDTTLSLTAYSADFVVSDIVATNPYFEIEPRSFTINAGETITLKLSFFPTDSGYTYSKFDIVNNLCPSMFFASGGYPGKGPNKLSLKLTHPNGGERFLIGDDTLITWKGITPIEKVKLEYSVDEGSNWKFITDTATGLEYQWKNIPAPPSDQCLVRVNQLGYESGSASDSWNRNFGGSDIEHAKIIHQTADGGYVIGGFTTSLDGDVKGAKGSTDYWIVKTDQYGKLEWQSVLGGNSQDFLEDIDQTYDGGFILAGYTSSSGGDVSGNRGKIDYWILKLNNFGQILWQKTFGGSNDDYAFSVKQCLDGNFIVAGFTFSDDGDVKKFKGYCDIWVLKLSNSGSLIWQKTIGGSKKDEAYSIAETLDGGCIVAGLTESSDIDAANYKGKSDFLVVRLDGDGNILWEKLLGGSDLDEASSVIQTSDGGYFVAGMSMSGDFDLSGNNGNYDYWMVKLDRAGNVQWQQSMGGSESDLAFSACETYYGSYIIAGYSASKDGDISANKGGGDAWVVNLSGDGDILWEKSLGGSSQDIAYSICPTIDGAFVAAGSSASRDGDLSGNNGLDDFWAVKISSEESILQNDVSDSLFTIVEPELSSKDIDMGQVLLGKMRDSLVTAFLKNPGTYPTRIDSIILSGDNAADFYVVSTFFPCTVGPGESKAVRFSFKPSLPGLRKADINIYGQADVLVQKIQGEGLPKDLVLSSDFVDFGKVELKSSKDTIIALIKNEGTWVVYVNKTEIAGPDFDQFEIIGGGGSFKLNPGEERVLTLRFSPNYMGRTSTDLNFHYSGAGSPARAQLFGEGIKPNILCDDTWFDYPDFSNPEKLNFCGTARVIDDDARLTRDKLNEAGGMWYEKRVPVAKGFVTKFQFRLSEGDNRDSKDGSAPGADGLAFVLQNSGEKPLGYTGGGIGYHKIENALAVEFDLFTNDDRQIENFYDPNGNHVAIQTGGLDQISSKHTEDYCLGVSRYIDNLYADGRIYSVKIEYNIEPGIMNVYLGEEDSLDSPILVVSEIVLEDILDLEDDIGAFVGITAATGKAVEKHDILNWYFCPFGNAPGVGVEEDNNDIISLNVIPNPVNEAARIEFTVPEEEIVSLKIIDVFGRKVFELIPTIKDKGSYSYIWDTSDISDGVYFCTLTVADKTIMQKIMKL